MTRVSETPPDRGDGAPVRRLKGHIDVLDARYAAGWALDLDRPDRPVEVSARIGTREIARALAAGERADLLSAGIGNGSNGFELLFDPLVDPADVSIHFADTDLCLDRPDRAPLAVSVDTVKRDWANSPYFERAEREIEVFWADDSVFASYFAMLDTDVTVDLACGHGRHSERFLAASRRLIVIDVFEGHVETTRQRLNDDPRVTFVVGTGYDFSPIPDNSVTAIVCYDSMVHFSADIVRSYLNDAARILAAGGRFLVHVSNHDTGGGSPFYGANPHARNHLTEELFLQMVQESGLALVRTEIVDWGGVSGLDRIALLEKSKSASREATGP